MLVISANSGIVPMTQEHIGYAIALEVPFFIIMTKVRFPTKLNFEKNRWYKTFFYTQICRIKVDLRSYFTSVK